MDGGWNLKALQRLIVTSDTYRQSSESTPELLERDPANILLAGGVLTIRREKWRSLFLCHESETNAVDGCSQHDCHVIYDQRTAYPAADRDFLPFSNSQR